MGNRLVSDELTNVMVQRAPLEPGETEPSPGEPETEPAAPEPAPATVIVVDDSAEEVAEGQMKKSDFVARLRTEVCAAAEASLAGTAYAAQGCPWIERWFASYEDISVERINRDLPRFAEAGPPPATAEDSIRLIAGRVRRSVSVWARTGEITGVPEGLLLPGMSPPGAGASASPASGEAPSGVAFKALPGGPRDPGDPQALGAQLGAGRPLDGGLRARMESAFGQSFGHVRVHTDGQAAGLSRGLRARAFTVGEHVAFGAGEYRPGTVMGDALVAHELAHVAQQGAAAEGVRPMRSDPASYGALERDADLAAAGAVASLWGLRLPALRRPFGAAPRLRSGLRLQRCGICDGGGQQTPAPGTTPSTTTPAPPTPAPAPAPPPPKPLFEQLQTGPERQKAIDKAIGDMGSKIDTSLLEGGKMFYDGTVTGGEGTTYEPKDKALSRKRKGLVNTKPYVEIYGGAFGDGWPLLKGTIWHEYQHVLQMAPKSKSLVPGVNRAGDAQEAEAYCEEIIAAEGENLHRETKIVAEIKGQVQELSGPQYVETVLWRRLMRHWTRLREGMKRRLQALFTRAKAAAERMVGHRLP